MAKTRKPTATQIEMLQAVDSTDRGATAHEFQGYRIGTFDGRWFRQATGDALMALGFLEVDPTCRARRIASDAGRAYLDGLIVEQVRTLLLTKPDRGHIPWLTVAEIEAALPTIGKPALHRAIAGASGKTFYLCPNENPSAAYGQRCIEAHGQRFHLISLND